MALERNTKAVFKNKPVCEFENPSTTISIATVKVVLYSDQY